jgi:ribose transport system permease protein
MTSATPAVSRRTRTLPVQFDLLVRYGLAVLLLIVLGLTSSSTFGAHRILDILGRASPLGVAAIGQTSVLLSGGIDLSIGPVINLTNVIAPVAMSGQDGNIVLAVFLSALAAGLVGLVNGILVAFVRVPALLATLAVGTIVQGGYFIYTRGQPSGNASPGFRTLANNWLGGNLVPWDFLLWLLVWGVMAALLYRTVFGRQFYGVGANPRASWLSGVRSSWHVVAAYVISALCACIAGLILTSDIGLASIGIGDTYTLDSIAAAVIGGTAFTGGIGTLGGTFAGVLVMTFLNTILSTLNVPQASQFIAQGIVIAGMMLVNSRLIRARR